MVCLSSHTKCLSCCFGAGSGDRGLLLLEWHSWDNSKKLERGGRLRSSWFALPGSGPLHYEQVGMMAARSPVSLACQTWGGALVLQVETGLKKKSYKLLAALTYNWSSVTHSWVGWEMLAACLSHGATIASLNWVEKWSPVFLDAPTQSVLSIMLS